MSWRARRAGIDGNIAKTIGETMPAGLRQRAAFKLHFPGPRRGFEEEASMLETIAIILIVLWLLGMVGSYTMSGFIHILLVVAIVLFLVRVISGRRVV